MHHLEHGKRNAMCTSKTKSLRYLSSERGRVHLRVRGYFAKANRTLAVWGRAGGCLARHTRMWNKKLSGSEVSFIKS